MTIRRLSRWAGGFLCCACFEAVPDEDAWVDAAGQAWDLCATCGPRHGPE